jgi:hypothetical protein
MPLEASARLAAILRISVYGIWFLTVCYSPFQRYALLPDHFVNPVGIMRLLPDAFWDVWLTQPVLVIYRLAFAALLVLGLLGIGPFLPISILIAICALLFDGTLKTMSSYSNHSQFPLLQMTLCLPLFPAIVDRLTLRPRTQLRADIDYQFPVTFCSLIFVVPYLFIAAHRLGKGMEIFFGPAMGTFLVNHSSQPMELYFDWGRFAFEYPWFARLAGLGFLGITIFELLAPLALLSRWFRYIWVPSIFLFHGSSAILMNIIFYEHMILLVVLFGGGAWLAEYLTKRAAAGGGIPA